MTASVLRPVLLLDVDGTLSPMEPIPGWRRGQLSPLGESGYARSVLVDRRVVRRLAYLHRMRIIEIEWCTSWGESARDWIGPRLGAPFHHLRVRTPEPGYKRSAMRSLLQRGRRVVQCDDDLDLVKPGAARARTDLLAVRPTREVGLTVLDIAHIEAWARRGTRPPARARMSRLS